MSCVGGVAPDGNEDDPWSDGDGASGHMPSLSEGRSYEGMACLQPPPHATHTHSLFLSLFHPADAARHRREGQSEGVGGGAWHEERIRGNAAGASTRAFGLRERWWPRSSCSSPAPGSLASACHRCCIPRDLSLHSLSRRASSKSSVSCGRLQRGERVRSDLFP